MNSPSRRSLTSLVVFTLVAGLLAGCGPEPIPSNTKKSRKENSVTPVTLLDSALELLKDSETNPESYRLAAQRLNQFLDTQDESKIPDIDPAFLEQIKPLLREDRVQGISRKRFDVIDSDHLQTCFLHRDIVNRVIADHDSDHDKVVAIFDWVIRNVQEVPVPFRKVILPPWFSPRDRNRDGKVTIDEWPEDKLRFATIDVNKDGAISPPEVVSLIFPPTRSTLIMGQGTHFDRAWVFMTLLRQAGFDNGFLSYPRVSGDQTVFAPWVVAAVAGDSMLLFDVRFGVPIPGPDGKGIATVQQLKEDPGLLQQMNVNEQLAYPIDIGDPSKLAVLVDSTPSYWAPKMAFLQEQLAGKNRVVLYVEFDALSERLRKASGGLHVGLWQVPLRIDAMVGSDKEDGAVFRTALGQLMFPFRAFPDVEQARLAHLRGQFDVAIKAYMNRRLQPVPSELNAVPPEQRAGIVNWVREDVTYFMGVLKFEQGDMNVASNWFRNHYLEKYKRSRWITGSWYHLGRCAEALNDPDTAIAYFTRDNLTPHGFGSKLRAKSLGWPAPIEVKEEDDQGQTSEDGEPSAEASADSEDEAAKQKEPENTQPADAGTANEPTDKTESEAESSDSTKEQTPAENSTESDDAERP